MNRISLILSFALIAAGCASAPADGVKRNRMRDCPPGMIQICETRRQREPSHGGDEEVPEYEFCRCETIG